MEEVATPWGLARRRVKPVVAEPLTSEQVQDLAQELERILSNENPNTAQLQALGQLQRLPPSTALQLIQKCLAASRDELVRSQAMFCLSLVARHARDDAVAIIQHVLESDPDDGVRSAAAGALGYIEGDAALESLIHCVYEDTNWVVRYSAVVSLGGSKNPRAVDLLISILNKIGVDDPNDALLAQAAIGAIAASESVEATEALLRFVGTNDFMTRLRVAEALGSLPPTQQSVKALEYLEKDASDAVAHEAMRSLKRAFDRM